jgi:hypothetical protein
MPTFRHREELPRPAIVVVLLALATLAPVTAIANMSVIVSTQLVTITGLTPGASIALLGVARDTGPYLTHVVTRRELLTDADNDGRIDYPPPAGIALRSMWIVVDVASGETVIATRAGYNPVPMKKVGVGGANSVNLTGNLLDIGRSRVDILVVRPKHGAWFTIARGRGTEAPDVSGRLRVDVAKLHPLAPSFGNAPAAFTPGDVVFVVDEEELEYSVLTVTAGGR